MSRTPLFRLLRRSMRLAQLSLVRPEPLDELIDVARGTRAAPNDSAGAPAGRGVSRRGFVAGGAAAGAALALQGCLQRAGATARAGALPSPRRDLPPVLIVGGGIAGLTAAYRLRQRGVPVRLFEAQERVGGRMYSLRGYFADGQVCELGGELFDTPHARIRALAAELDVQLDDLHQEDPALDTIVWHFGGARRTQAEVIAALRPVADRLAAERAGWRADFEPTYRTTHGVEALDRMTVAEWLDRAGVSGWIRALLDVGYTTEYGLPPDRQSALNFLTLVSATPSSFEIFGESDERFRAHRGNDLIPLTLGERLGDAIESGTVLEAVSRRADGAYVCTLRRGSSSVTATAPHVILAIPFTTLRDVRLDLPLPDAKRRAIAELGYGANAKLMVGFSERVWRTRHRSNGSLLTSLPFQLTWETSRAQPGAAGILTNFTGGAHAMDIGRGTAEEQASALVSDLDRVFAGAAAAHAGMKAARFHWPTFRWTRGSYAGYLPGQWTSIRGAEGEPVDNLHFAGEHTSLVAQGFMEGGCETGERAAAAVLAAVGVSVGGGAAPRRLRPREPARLLASAADGVAR